MKPDQSVVFCILIRFLKVCATFKIILSKWMGSIPTAILGCSQLCPDIHCPLSVRRKLLSVLDAIEFSQDIPELLQLDFFERTQIEQVISNCEHANEQGHTVCNVKVGPKSRLLCFFNA